MLMRGKSVTCPWRLPFQTPGSLTRSRSETASVFEDGVRLVKDLPRISMAEPCVVEFAIDQRLRVDRRERFVFEFFRLKVSGQRLDDGIE